MVIFSTGAARDNTNRHTLSHIKQPANPGLRVHTAPLLIAATVQLCSSSVTRHSSAEPTPAVTSGQHNIPLRAPATSRSSISHLSTQHCPTLGGENCGRQAGCSSGAHVHAAAHVAASPMVLVYTHAPRARANAFALAQASCRAVLSTSRTRQRRRHGVARSTSAGGRVVDGRGRLAVGREELYPLEDVDEATLVSHDKELVVEVHHVEGARERQRAG